MFYCRADIFKYLYFPSTITDTSHNPSTITLTKLYLSTYCAEAFKSHYIGTYIFFFLTPSFPVIGLGQLKYRLGSVNISLDWLILVRIS